MRPGLVGSRHTKDVSADVSELSFDSRTSIIQSSRSLQNEIMYLKVKGNDVLSRKIEMKICT
jgi:hypothetical protein